MSEWISVGEYLPDYGVKVLACFRGQFAWIMFVAEKCQGELRAAGYATPDYWKPLPDPPKMR